MTGTVGATQVRLHRDALNTPWGLRLQGGKDFKTPLTVQRVFVGSPADGELHRGDVILAIENYDASQLTHKQAQDIIKAAGSVISLRVRGGSSRPAAPVNQPAPRPAPQSYGTDYTQRGGGLPARPAAHPDQQHGMIGKLQQSLNHAIWQPGDQYDQGEEEYQPRSVTDLMQQFTPPKDQHRQQYRATPGGEEDDYIRQSVTDIKKHFSGDKKKPRTRAQARPPPQHPLPDTTGEFPDDGESSKGAFYDVSRGWKRPDPSKTGSLPKSLTEPGWSPGQGGQQSSSWHPVRGPGGPNTGAFNPVNRPSPVNRPHQPGAQRPSSQPRHLASENPAWAGTLRSSGGPKPWEVREAESIAPGSAGPAPHHGHEPARAQSLPGPSPAQCQPHQPKVQNVHYSDGGQRYEQHDPDPDSHQNAKVVHMQYNSPLGLYSKKSVEEAMTGQVAGKPGEGTIGVTSTGPGKNFDPSRSEVLRMLAEEGQTRGPPVAHQHHGGHHHDQYQSPAMRALEHNVGGEEDFGTSDF